MNILSNYQKVCPVCQESFQAKRTNQIYCVPKCKTLKNNYKAKVIKEDYETITYGVNQILWSNRNFLKNYVEQEVNYASVSKTDFQLRFITNFYKDRDLNTNVFVVYDYAYYFINQETIKIIRYE